MPQTDWWGTQTTFPQIRWIIQIRYDSIPLKQKSDKNEHSFFPPVSCYQSKKPHIIFMLSLHVVSKTCTGGFLNEGGFIKKEAPTLVFSHKSQ